MSETGVRDLRGGIGSVRRRLSSPMPLGVSLPGAYLPLREAATTVLPTTPVYSQPLSALGGWHPVHQRWRNTCVAFAVTACLDLIAFGHDGTMRRHAPQFLYWKMRQTPPDPLPPQWATGATLLGQARHVLETYGCCEEHLSPYRGDRITPVDGPAPTDDARRAALKNRYRASGYWHRPSQPNSEPPAAAIIKQLVDLRPVAIAVEVFRVTHLGSDVEETHWNIGSAEEDGRVRELVNPGPDTTVGGQASDASTRGGHAVCVIGFEPDGGAPGGGWFVFRNSMGPRYGARQTRLPSVPPGLGLGIISVAHVNRAFWEWLSLERLPAESGETPDVNRRRILTPYRRLNLTPCGSGHVGHLHATVAAREGPGDA